MDGEVVDDVVDGKAWAAQFLYRMKFYFLSLVFPD